MGKGSKGERMAATPQQQQVLQQQQRQLRAMKLQGQQAQRSGAVSTAGSRQQRKRPGAIKLGAPQDRVREKYETILLSTVHQYTLRHVQHCGAIV